MLIKKFGKLVLKIYYNVFFKLEITGQENLIEDQGYVLVANHRSNHDPLIVGANIKPIINFMAKKELFKNKFYETFFSIFNAFPVDRNNIDITAVKKSLRILKNKKQGLLMFPEGTRNRTNQPLEAKGGVAMIAIKAKVPIIPVSIDSNYNYFSKIKVKIHEPIHLDEYFNERLSIDEYQAIVQKIIDDIYEELECIKEGSYEN